MIEHNVRIFYRFFKGNKSTYLINIIGLSSALACIMLMSLWINDELSIDKFHENDSQLFQVMGNQHNAEGITTTNETPSLLAKALLDEIPQIESAEYASDPAWFGTSTISADEKSIRADGKFASKGYFNIFSYSLSQGDKDHLLTDKNAIVISESLAKKLFNTSQSIIGKHLKVQLGSFKETDLFISGIFKDIPKNSSDQFDFALSFDLHNDLTKNESWGNYTALTYLVVKSGTDVNQLNKSIENFIKSKDEYSKMTLFLKRYSEKYLYGKYENGVQVGGRIDYIRLISVIAFFILVMACINFMNLSTAKASKRFKEVVIKKAIGSSRKTLIYQYLSESLSMALLSLFIAIILVELFLPQFNELIGKQISFSFTIHFLLFIFGITVFTGLISGSYPAFYLSSFNSTMRGEFKKSIGELWVRKGLLFFQFSLSVILIVFVVVISKQIEFTQSKYLGYDKENLVYFKKDGALAESKKLDIFLSEVKAIPEVINASSISRQLVKSGNYTEGIYWKGRNPNENYRFENITVDYDMIETLGIKMKDGRSFSRDFSSDTTKIIFNEAAIKSMGIANPVGTRIALWGEIREIVGVTKDFHFESLHENVKPAFLKVEPRYTNYIMVRIRPDMDKKGIQKLQKIYNSFNPGFAFDLKLVSENHHIQYVAENRIAVLSKYFAGLAILISCLGLFGLAAFTAERRFKEIGIRKVLGITNFGIIYLLYSEFTKIVLVSAVVALPVSYTLTKMWLNSFAFRIGLDTWFFISAGLIVIFITWLTVGMQTLKVTKVNVSDCLRMT